MYMFVYSLNLSLSADCSIILTNIKQETLLSWYASHFSSLASNLLLSAQRKPISHTSANGEVRLFVYFVCLSVSEWVSKQETVRLHVWPWMCMRWPAQWGLNWCHYQPLCVQWRWGELQPIWDCCRVRSHTDMFKPGLRVWWKL